MSHLIDETGNRYGRLLVFARDKRRKDGHAYWRCHCDCGKVTSVAGSTLRYGVSLSCGCYQRDVIIARNLNAKYPYKDEIGNKYGKLTVIKKVQQRQHRNVRWLCRCDCGKKTIVNGNALRSGGTASCGCNNNKGRKRIYRADGTWYLTKRAAGKPKLQATKPKTRVQNRRRTNATAKQKN
jgi:hypothetical protein